MSLSLMNMLGLSSSVRIAHIASYWKFFLLHYMQVLCFTEKIMPILRILCYNGSLVTWTVVSLTASKFKPLISLRLASPCPVLCSFSWFCMTSACRLHNFIIWSYTYGKLKAVCKSRTGVHLGKFPMVRRTSFCRLWNCKRWVPWPDSQADRYWNCEPQSAYPQQLAIQHTHTLILRWSNRTSTNVSIRRCNEKTRNFYTSTVLIYFILTTV
jgi:hypothetical protein